MRYSNVCLEGVAYTLPDEIVTSSEVEARLEPLYQRLRLPEGRLELMTGIRERRFWPPQTLPGTISARTIRHLLEQTGFDPARVGALVHGSVCRDYLEPATACGVHHAAGLADGCLVYDVSNACLGLLNGVVQIANMIELGQIEAGIVVGTEDARPLVENTIQTLNTDTSLTREQMKLAVASLTIGSGSAAILLTHQTLSADKHRLLSATGRAHSVGHELCRGQDHQTGSSVAPLMQTDSEQLLEQGVLAARATFTQFLQDSGWTTADVHKTVCHQVGSAHRKLLLKSLDLDPAKDHTTYETLGNTGSVALPITLAQAVEQRHIQAGERVALLGIGSGINVLMLGLEW